MIPEALVTTTFDFPYWRGRIPKNYLKYICVQAQFCESAVVGPLPSSKRRPHFKIGYIIGPRTNNKMITGPDGARNCACEGQQQITALFCSLSDIYQRRFRGTFCFRLHLYQVTRRHILDDRNHDILWPEQPQMYETKKLLREPKCSVNVICKKWNRPKTCLDMKSIIFLDITQCSPLKVKRRFGGTYRHHLQGQIISRARCACHLLSRQYLRSSVHNHSGENLKSCMLGSVWNRVLHVTAAHSKPVLLCGFQIWQQQQQNPRRCSFLIWILSQNSATFFAYVFLIFYVFFEQNVRKWCFINE
jgi:hypothetical protein